MNDKKMQTTKQVASPTSTGGDGTFFEQHVNAYWLTLLLVQAIPPILTDCVVKEVHFQVEHLHWNTDDFLLVGETGSGSRRNLLGQVKKHFVVSSSNEDCQNTIKDFWKDFRNAEVFSSDTDRFSIVTLRGTNVLLEHFVGLLDCARASRNADDFVHRLHTPGFVHASVKRHYGQIQSILNKLEGCDVSASEIWPFLKVIHLISLDLNTSTAQSEALAKTLLAHATSQSDPVGTAGATWNALLAEVGQGMPRARSYTRSSLPTEVLGRHSPLSGEDHRCLTALKDHSSIILDGIRTHIGKDTHLPRAALVQGLSEQLQSHRVVVVTGKAGSGKSAIAKDTLSSLADDNFLFCFRAEEFALAHLNGTLLGAGVSCGSNTLTSILAGQDKKILLVESVERLLEASTRDAFSDLLRLVAQDATWRLLLTCRDYSVDLVCEAFLNAAGVGHTRISVGPLDDTELADIESIHPEVSRLLASAQLRSLLRNPYVLGLAVRIQWSDSELLPSDELEFRACCWRTLVRKNHHTASGMPQRREKAFVEIARRRAKALAMYVECGDIDHEAVRSLGNDSLIIYSAQKNTMLAPAHDVLEDWAILEWINGLYVQYQQSVEEFAEQLGTEPAIRRTYRKWISDLIIQDKGAADYLLSSVLEIAFRNGRFRDDTIIAVLRSSKATKFIERHRDLLLRHDKCNLRRVIHLLRVGCVKSPDMTDGGHEFSTFITEPEGTAWSTVLNLVQRNIETFDTSDKMLLLGLVEDWTRGVSLLTPYPEGFDAAFTIAYWLLDEFNNYNSKDQQSRTLKIIAKIPNANLESFSNLLRGRDAKGGRDDASEELRKLVFEELGGTAASRDCPELVVEVGIEHFLDKVDESDNTQFPYGSRNIESAFGLKDELHHGFFPASAYRGVFLQLLRHHPKWGRQFVLNLCNYCVDCYGKQVSPLQYVENPYEITLTLTNGSTRSQWCNPRLWGMYRGLSVTPYVLQSSLMALEVWLLEIADSVPKHLDEILLKILAESNSVAISAVVASVATAYPHQAKDTLLSLLSASDCIIHDRGRMASEANATAWMGLIPQPDSLKRIFEEERNQSGLVSHRKNDLEYAILNLQLGVAAVQVQAALDHHKSQLPPIEDQDEYDRLWRFSLHRMDFRQYVVANPGGTSTAESEAEPGGGKNRVYLTQTEPEPDLQRIANDTCERFNAANELRNLKLWSIMVFRGEDPACYPPTEWKNRLEKAISLDSGDSGPRPSSFELDAPQGVASVCVRYFWDELSTSERQWCVDAICCEIDRNKDIWNRHERVQKNPIGSDRFCAWVLPPLLTKVADTDYFDRVLDAIVVSITHPLDEIRIFVAHGISYASDQLDQARTLWSVNLIESQARLVQVKHEQELKKSFRQRQEFDKIEQEVADHLRLSFTKDSNLLVEEDDILDTTSDIGAMANVHILTILESSPDLARTKSAFRKLAVDLVQWWKEREAQRDRTHKISYDTTEALTKLLDSYLFEIPYVEAMVVLEPILGVADDHPDELESILHGLIDIEDRVHKPSHFWLLWELFADKVSSAKWLAEIDKKHGRGVGLLRAVFLGNYWKDNVRHWHSLEGHADNIDNLFEQLPASSVALECYIGFLYQIGEQSLPNAFIRIERKLASEDAMRLLEKENTVFMLESLLQRYVYGRPLELKQRSVLQNSILDLLDLLVERGSSNAFRMRDDFVTPLPII